MENRPYCMKKAFLFFIFPPRLPLLFVWQYCSDRQRKYLLLSHRFSPLFFRSLSFYLCLSLYVKVRRKRQSPFNLYLSQETSWEKNLQGVCVCVYVTSWDADNFKKLLKIFLFAHVVVVVPVAVVVGNGGAVIVIMVVIVVVLLLKLLLP